MNIGYARTSTADQEAGFASQLADLSAIGCEKIFQEQISSVAQRPQLAEALDFIREGDVLVVTKLDRLARSIAHLCEIAAAIKAKGAELKILNLGIDTGTPTGQVILHILGAIAEFERTLMLERQRVGVDRAKAEGKYKGRAPTARAKTDDVLKLRDENKGPTVIAAELDISRTSVYRILNDNK